MSKKKAPPPPPDTLQEFIARMDENCRAELKRQQKTGKRGFSVIVHGFADLPAELFDTPES